MFSNKLDIKLISVTIAAFFIYVLIAGIVLVQLWLPDGIATEQAMILAEQDLGLQIQSMFAGLIGCLLVGAMSVRFGKELGYKNTLVCGIFLTLYGVLGVYLHPQHAVWAQFIKVLTPLPITLLAAMLLCNMRKTSLKTA
ncbi:hypothetical protein [Pseudoalteromonas sp. BDTF-M6]|uniref:hypothetical protein n=1 Tax=Pseudoalteromonas sp. BDTF-M6 TaxID=2796132 RepID=UPI001BB01760|nr:hypothetical protein [Pseudoalteromonas sp. BDTF-M6]MBS3796458.1 hypothetical protein [Pseudoalteromonas sp. BDTF-M6]